MLTNAALTAEIEFYRNLEIHYKKIVETSPAGTLYLKKQYGKERLYLYDDKAEHYISRKALPSLNNFVDGLAARKVLKIIENNLMLLNVLESQFMPYNEIDFDDLQREIDIQIKSKLQAAFPDKNFDKVSAQSKVHASSSDKAREWLEEPTIYNSFMPEKKTNRTPKGIYVRSKSELLIATMLESYNIPYKYEAQLHLSNRIIYPDFTIWDKNREQLVYWEHFGMMWDQKYNEKNKVKIYDYLESGYRLGDNFIATYDDETGSIDMGLLHKIINTFL